MSWQPTSSWLLSVSTRPTGSQPTDRGIILLSELLTDSYDGISENADALLADCPDHHPHGSPAPAVILGVVFWLYMTDWPSQASWLMPAQRDWLIARLNAERSQREAIRNYSLKQALLDKRMRYIRRLWDRIVPATDRASTGRRLRYDRDNQRHPLRVRRRCDGALGPSFRPHRKRPRHVAIAYAVGAAGLIATALMTDPVLTMVTLVIAAMGQSSTGPTFWSLPTAMLSGTAAAGGIALINALGNLGGFFGPYLFGLIKDASGGSFTFGLMALALGPIVSASIVLALGHDRRLEHIPAHQASAGR